MGVNSTGSFAISNWINKENALATYSGLHLNRVWEDYIQQNSSTDQKSTEAIPNSHINSLIATIKMSFYLFSTLSQIEHKLSPERVTPYAWGFFPDLQGRFFKVALVLVTLNAAKFFKRNQPSQNDMSKIDKCLNVISQATPYVMIITNIFVTIIQTQKGDSSAWITLVFTGITLIDITVGKPKNYKWYLDKALGYPVAATALYYGDNKIRSKIVGNFVSNYILSIPSMKRMLQKYKFS